MMKRNSTMLISELTEDERKFVNQWIEMLPKWFRQCECYLREYGAGEQTVFKLLQIMKETRVMIDEDINQLIEKHRLPNDLKETDRERVLTMRDVVTKGKE